MVPVAHAGTQVLESRGDAVEGTGQAVFRVPWAGLKLQLLLRKVTLGLCSSPLSVKLKETEGWGSQYLKRRSLLGMVTDCHPSAL